jgi:ribosomal protein L29
MSAYCYDDYFNETFDLDDFLNVVTALDANLNLQKPIKPLKKKTKKSYAVQIVELKQEIMDLRQEIEARDSQLLSLLHNLHR